MNPRSVALFVTAFALPAHSAAAAPPETVAECVQRHITQSGGAHAVTKLSCPGDAGEDCTPPDLSVLNSLENLTELDLSHRCVSEIGAIATLASLEALDLQEHRVSDIRPLAALRELRSLNLASSTRIRSSWGERNQLPFSQLTQLVKLNLSGTEYTIVHPLGSLTSLEELHLDGCYLASIRPLGPLTNLRELHVDNNSFEDLSPLAGMTQLEVLSANGNTIRSIEPLRQLTRLRSVSLDGNCVASCELAGAESSCMEPQSECPSVEISTVGLELSVPIDHVERLVPMVDFPIWTEIQIAEGFELIRTSERIDWTKARGGCDGRAAESAALLEQAKFPALTSVYAYGNLRPLTTTDASGFYWYDWHIAVAARTADGFVVLDPALSPHPLRLRDWYVRLVDSKDADLNFSCADYAKGGSPACPGNVDERGALLVDDLQTLRGAICNQLGCGLSN